MRVILYSNHCPQCNALSQMLNNANIEYEEINDEKIMREKGFMSVPMLEVDKTILNFAKAIKWIQESRGTN